MGKHWKLIQKCQNRRATDPSDSPQLKISNEYLSPPTGQEPLEQLACHRWEKKKRENPVARQTLTSELWSAGGETRPGGHEWDLVGWVLPPKSPK